MTTPVRTETRTDEKEDEVEIENEGEKGDENDNKNVKAKNPIKGGWPKKQMQDLRVGGREQKNGVTDGE